MPGPGTKALAYCGQRAIVAGSRHRNPCIFMELCCSRGAALAGVRLDCCPVTLSRWFYAQTESKFSDLPAIEEK